MKIQILGSVLVGGIWHEPGVGNYEPKLAEHLVEIGVAIPIETKVVEVVEKKSHKTTSASQPAQALPKKIVRKRGPRKPKLSQ